VSADFSSLASKYTSDVEQFSIDSLGKGLPECTLVVFSYLYRNDSTGLSETRYCAGIARNLSGNGFADGSFFRVTRIAGCFDLDFFNRLIADDVRRIPDDKLPRDLRGRVEFDIKSLE